MIRQALHALLCAVLALGGALARASTGLAELPGLGGDGPVTVFYPSTTEAAQVQRGPFRFNLAWQGAPQRGNGRLIVLSHGSGGSPWTYGDLAQQLVSAGFVVAVPEHAGDNWHDMAKVGPDSWKLRPLEVSRAIDAIGRDTRFAPLLDLAHVGMYGMSAGGHTALTLAGGRWSPARMLAHCEANLAQDFAACTGAASELDGNALDGIKKTVAMWLIRWKRSGDPQWYGHTDPRIKAVLAGVPYATDFDLHTLSTPAVPLGLIQADKDLWLTPKFHIGPVIAACGNCELVARLPTGGHGSLLSPLPPDMSPRMQRLLGDPPGFDRAEVPAINQRITAFFQRHLLP